MSRQALKRPGCLRLQRQAQVLVDREAAEQVGDLERAGDALLADAVRRQPLDGAAVQTHDAAARREQPRYEIEQGRLAGAIRTDQSVDLAGTNVRLAFVTARMPPKCLETLRTSSGPLPAGRARERRQRQSLVDLALAHGRLFLGGGRKRRRMMVQMPARPPGENSTKPTNTRPNHSSQLPSRSRTARGTG